MTRTPLQEAWTRWRKHKAARVGAWLVGAVFVAGFTAPLITRGLVGLSPVEQHTGLAFQPPGARDASFDHPAYDGDKTAFAALDRDGDGRIRCHLERVPGLDAKTLLTRAVGTDRWPQEPGRVDLGAVVAVWSGRIVCPELAPHVQGEREFSFLIERFDVAQGDSAPMPGVRRPDGFVSRAEFALARLDAKAFAAADRNRDGRIERQEAVLAGLPGRIQPEHLIAAHDADRDLSISAAEFPGLPAPVTFWLGTDQKGRDLLGRLLHGAQVSLLVGVLGALVSFLIGVSYGAIAGYAGGRLDNAMMRAVDVLYGLPFLFIVILLLVVVGRSMVNLFIALGAVSWLTMARIVRGQVLSLRRREFVEAAEAMGLSPARILVRHVLPNTLGPVVVYATLSVPAIVLEEAFLSFLGLGVQPPDASWGTLIAEGARSMTDRPWLILYPSAVLALTVLGLNFLGDGLRDALDPRGRR
jgi:oligopeptide transport system permease protein